MSPTGVAAALLGVDLQHILVKVRSGKESVQETETTQFLNGMYENRYVIFHKDSNIHYWRYHQCVEFALVKLHPAFFQETK